MLEFQAAPSFPESSASGRTPTVSIGMPVYNGAEYIRETLDALLAQTFTDFELIISDNASTDETAEICREYAERDLRIVYIRQEGNIGARANFQLVLDKARGAYFMWAAADDRLGTSRTLSDLVKSLDDGFELAFPDVDLLDETKGTTERGLFSSIYREKKHDGVTALVLKYPSYMIYGLFVTACLRRFCIYLDQNSDLPSFSEGVFVHAVSERLKCAFVKKALLIYRRHTANASTTVIPPVLFKSFLKYSYRVFSFYEKSSYSAFDKFRYLAVLGLVHSKYALLLLLSTLKFYLSGLLSRFGLQLDRN